MTHDGTGERGGLRIYRNGERIPMPFRVVFERGGDARAVRRKGNASEADTMPF